MLDNVHQNIFVIDNRFVIFLILTYIAYVTVQSYHGKQLN